MSAPPFGSTDFVGEYGSSSLPQIGNNGVVYSANDAIKNPNVGNIECDPLRKVIYTRHLFVPHIQIVSSTGCTYGYGYHYNADTFDPITGLPTLKWWNLKTSLAASAFSPPPTAFAVDGAGDVAGDAATGGLPASGYTLTSLPQVGGYQSLCMNFGTAQGDFVMDGCAPRCFGFKAFMSISQPRGISPQSLYYAAARWRVSGSAGAPRWYSVSYQIGVGIAFLYNDSIDAQGDPLPATWIPADVIKQGAGLDSLLTPQTSNTSLPMLDVRLLAGQMTISLGSEDTPYPWPHMLPDATGTHDWYIDSFQVAAGSVQQLIWEFHPIKFATTAGYVSTETNVGYIPTEGQIGNARYIAHTEPHFANPATGQVRPPPKNDSVTGATNQIGFLPPGSAATAITYDINGDLIRYVLTLTNTKVGTYKGVDYADFTACVKSVSMNIPGVQLTQPPSQLTILGSSGAPNMPENIQVSHTFDLSRLCVTRSCALTFNNFLGVWTNGAGNGIVDNHGQFAIEVNLGALGFGALQTEFIGVGNRRFTSNWQSGGNDKLTLFGEDLWCMLDVPVWNLPYFDGWNVYYVMAYLAGKATLTPSQMQFTAYVPNNPYDKSPGLPDSQQFFMPIGVAGTPLTRFTGGQHIKDIMLKISQTLGCIMYFDSISRLHFEKFLMPTASTPTRVFSHVDGNPLTGGEGLRGIWSGSYSGGFDEQRNSVTVIGVNAFSSIWNPKVSHQPDLDSIYNDAATNYKGYPDPMVWVDNLFVNAGFADAAAIAMLKQLRIPDRQVSFSTWYQPDGGVYPGDMISVITPRSGAQGYSFFVVGVTNTFAKGQASRCDIQARIVPQG